MSRSTQYIGLHDQAVAWLKEYCISIPTTNKTEGMFEEDVPLGFWVIDSNFKEIYNFKSIKEVVQCEPWSSGPMIFTCLEVTYDCVSISDDGIEEPMTDLIFEWWRNPDLRTKFTELDYSTGGMWV